MFKAATVAMREPYSSYSGQHLGEALVRKLGQKPDACWVFCAPDKGKSDLLGGICDVVETPNVIGCTTDGEISHRGLSTESVVLAGICSDQIDFQVAFVEGISGHCEQAGKMLASSLGGSPVYVQLFSDGLTSNCSALLRGMASVLGEKIPIAGGSAGDNGRFVHTWQFAGRQVFSDTAAVMSG